MANKYPFQNTALPLTERVKDLISRLTIEEKAGFIPTRNKAVDRLGIKEWSIGAEGAHGYVDRDGHNTTFPQTIGLASTWDRNILHKVGVIASTEARVFYKMNDKTKGLAIWSPTIDMERDPRWGRTEEGYGEDPILAGELSCAYIRGAQGDHPFYLRVSCGPKHFFANNNEKDRINCNCSIPSRCMHEYYLAPFKISFLKAKAVSMMTAYNEVNGIPMMLHPMLNEIVKDEWGLEGHIVTDGGDFMQTVTAHHYFDSHAETIAASLKNGADSMTDNVEFSYPAVLEAVEKKLITEAELDEHLERILAIRFRFGQFDPDGLCPYDAIDEKDLMKDEYIEIAREAVRKSIVLLKNENNKLPLRPESVEGTIAVLGPLANKIHLDWYTGIPTKVCTPLEGLQNLYGKEKIVTAEYRDIVSFTTEDGRPLVLTDVKNRKLLCVGKQGESPARFYKEDWGWGSQTLADVESGLLLESPFWRKEAGGSDRSSSNIEDEKAVIAASGKSSHSWFAFSVFNLIPQENGMVVLRTFDNRRLTVQESGEKINPVFLRDDVLQGSGELFKMTIEKEGFVDVVDVASKADKVIFFAGNNPMINGRECIDRPSLNLPPKQEEILNRVFNVNPKTTLVMISGYPFTCKEAAKKIPAIIWMAPGIQETGRGLADIIGGSYSPAGRLPLTWYEDEKQLPSIMEYDIINAGTTYQYFTGNVLWPFGHGLSYCEFEYSDLSIGSGEWGVGNGEDRCSKISVANKDDTVNISFKLRNTGTMQADEVPQLYVTVAGKGNAPWEKKRPKITLKSFDRVSLSPNEERVINFELPVNELVIWDAYNARFCLEEGVCTISIGTSSKDIRLTGSFKINGETFCARKITSPIYAERFDDYSNCFLHEKRGNAIPAVFHNDANENSAWIRFASLDFTQGVTKISAIVQGVPGSRIEVRLDSPDGELVGTIDVPNTGPTCSYELDPNSPRRRTVWAYAETATKKIIGVHDLYLVLYGKTGIWKLELN